MAGYDFGQLKCMYLLYAWLVIYIVGCVAAIMWKYGRV